MPKKKPKLLTGGNPQIPKGEGDEPVQAYITAMPGWKHDIGKRLDTLAEKAVPKVQKAVKWNMPLYGTEKHGWFFSFSCFTKYVKLAFYNGTSLKPLPPIESSHETVRYYKIYEGEKLDEAQITKWLKQASKIPGWKQ